MVDAAGNPIAWLYSQRRFEVPAEQIANTMKLAIVSIEDKRFAEHNGMDWPGTLTGLSGYLSGNLDTRGGSTIEQQAGIPRRDSFRMATATAALVLGLPTVGTVARVHAPSSSSAARTRANQSGRSSKT
jgi:Transglycosylase